MQTGIHIFPQGERKNQRGRIPVENSEFSTFSTDFSTGVFHRQVELWIFNFGSHKNKRRFSSGFPLFCGSWILPWEDFLCKNLVLTRQAEEISACTVVEKPMEFLCGKDLGKNIHKNFPKGVDFV